MRYADFAAYPNHATINRFHVATSYVPPHAWGDLNDIRIQHGTQTRIIAVRSLEPRFRGSSVDIDCGSPEDAARLLFVWCALGIVMSDRKEGGHDWPRSVRRVR